jgi:hypothetical protein
MVVLIVVDRRFPGGEGSGATAPSAKVLAPTAFSREGVSAIVEQVLDAVVGALPVLVVLCAELVLFHCVFNNEVWVSMGKCRHPHHAATTLRAVCAVRLSTGRLSNQLPTELHN